MDEDINEDKVLLFLLLQRRRRKLKCRSKRRKSRFWVRDIFRQREKYGEYSKPVQKLKTGDREFCFRGV